MTPSHKTLLFVVGAILLSVPAQAQTSLRPPERRWIVRLRATALLPANQSNAFAFLDSYFPSNTITLGRRSLAEADVTYFITRNAAVELAFFTAQQQTIKLEGDRIGNFKQRPVTLVAQYHFETGNMPVKPYISAGLNITSLSDVRLNFAGEDLDLSRSSYGFAVGAGTDIRLTPQAYLNLDFKYLDYNAEVTAKSGGRKLAKAQIDPSLLSLGIGYRF